MQNKSSASIAGYSNRFLVLLILAAAWIFSLLNTDSAVLSGAQLLLASLAFGIIPGLLTLQFYRRRRFIVRERELGFAVAISIIINQVLTTVSILAHFPVHTVANVEMTCLLLASLLASLLFRDSTVWKISIRRSVWIPLSVMSVLVYFKGASYFSDEEMIHVSLIRKLGQVLHPQFDNFFMSPATPYTHPFPGTHFFMAIISVFTGLDTAFVYHKLRFFWTATSLLFFGLNARLIFKSRKVVWAVMVTAYFLILSGVFADFQNYHWAQLVPFSHPSDVAMGVYLPALLFLAFCFLTLRNSRAVRSLFALTVLFQVALCMMHVREALQFVIYLAAYLVFVALSWLIANRRRSPAVAPLKKEALRLLVLTLTSGFLLVVYAQVHHRYVQQVAFLDAQEKLKIWQQLTDTSWIKLLTDFAIRNDPLYYGLFPVLLLLSPLLFLRRQQRTSEIRASYRPNLKAFMGMGIVFFLLVSRIPVLTYLFIYSTYYEALALNVRNVTYFLQLSAGYFLFELRWIIRTKIPSKYGWAALALVGAALGGLANVSTEKWMTQENFFFGFIFLAVGVLLLRRWPSLAFKSTTRRWKFAEYLALVLPLVALSLLWSASPLNVHRISVWVYPHPKTTRFDNRPSDIHAEFLCQRPGPINTFLGKPVEDTISCPPPPDFIKWTMANVPAEKVLATNTFNVVPLNFFLPQYTLAWPLVYTRNISAPDKLFDAYYSVFTPYFASHKQQPIYDPAQNSSDRIEVLRKLKVDYVVVDPQYTELLRAKFAETNSHLKLVFEAQSWLLYEVIP